MTNVPTDGVRVPPDTTMLELLDLETVEVDLFRGRRAEGPAHRLFGGHVAAQALISAARTTDQRMREHSLHAYFLRPGDSTTPVVFSVDRLQDGRSFARRRVTAVQHGEAILCLEASFTTDISAVEHHVPAPAVPGPEGLPVPGWPSRNGFAPWRPFDVRAVPAAGSGGDAPAWPPREDVWFRLRTPIPADGPVPPAAVLTYASDLTLAATLLRPTGGHGVSGLTSLDHVVWFHDEVPLDGWLLYVKSCRATGRVRGLAEGQVFTQDGRLIASVAQEGLVHRAGRR